MRFSLKQHNIQNLINKQFPVSNKLLFVDVRLSDPVIVLIDDSERFGIRLLASIGLTDKWSVCIETYIDGDIVYYTDLGELFLKKVKVEFLLKDKLTQIFTWPIKNLVSRLIIAYVQRTPIYHFNQNDFAHKLARSRIKDLKIKNRSLVFEFTFF